MMMNYKWCWLVLLSVSSCFIFLTSCQNSDTETSSFEEFYARFHNDSVYQMQHIRFPLEGLPSFADSVLAPGQTFVWTQGKWDLHTEDAIKSSDAEQEFTPFGDHLIIENMFIQNRKYATERKFLRDPQTQEWYLIYYAAPNVIKQ